jgi:hypothetical protein
MWFCLELYTIEFGLRGTRVRVGGLGFRSCMVCARKRGCLNCKKAVSCCTYQEYRPLDIACSFWIQEYRPAVSRRLEGRNDKSTSWCCNRWAGRMPLAFDSSRRQTEQCAFYDLTEWWQKSIWNRCWNAPRVRYVQSVIRHPLCTAWFGVC